MIIEPLTLISNGIRESEQLQGSINKHAYV